ncbi:MAG: (2Fe-2S)-binding protein [Gammaproteobacteria bacterium]|nr:(2Fe-2S)-binding protein [Gammaproteobacteria bacterium]
MYICICKQVTDKQLREAITKGACTIEEIRACLGASSECGSCLDSIHQIIAEYAVPVSDIKIISTVSTATIATSYTQINS